MSVAGVDGSMAHLSDGLFTTAIAVYSVGMVAFVSEYAFGRRGRVARSLTVDAPARELVGVAGGGGPSGPATGTVATATKQDGGRLESSEPGSAADRIGRLALAITVLGMLVHAGSIVIRATAVDAVPWSNMYEFASVSGLVAVVAFVGVMWRAPQLRHLGGFVLLPVILLMFLAGTVLYSKAQPLVPALQSYWLAIHVSLVAVAEGAFMTSAILALLYLLKQRHDRIAATPGARIGALTSYGAKLPAAATLDKAAYRIIAFSFPLYTVAIIAGAIWAEAAWGRYWGWDPKETWAFVVWVVYAGYLHARATAGWKGRLAAWVNIAAFGSIIFNFFVVNMVISGLHSYAGLS
jgi:cytochrome c-type biogenesis protein CcsB